MIIENEFGTFHLPGTVHLAEAILLRRSFVSSSLSGSFWHKFIRNVAPIPWLSILLMLVGAGMLYIGRTSTKPEADLHGCQNNQGACVDQADCDGQKVQTACEARIGHSLRLHVQNPPGPKESTSRLVLFLNGVALTGVNALPTGEPGWFRFYLRYEPGSEAAWKTLLHEPKFWDKNKPLVPVSLGVENSVAYDTAVRIRLGYYDRLWLWIWWASSLATLSLLWHFRSALKVPVTFVTQTEGQSVPAGSEVLKYSLARVQLAFWFFLILSGYLFVCWMTWELKLLNTALVGLLGVSGATAIGSAIVDKNKAIMQQRSDAVELARLQQQGASLSQVQQMRKGRLETAAQLRKERVDRWRVDVRFSSFVRDILSDEDSDTGKVEIYRLQNALWSLFLGITFVRVIWNTLALPDFDSNLVLLTGVSSLTYVGLKNSK